MLPDAVILSPALPDNVRALIQDQHHEITTPRIVRAGLILIGLAASMAAGGMVWWLLQITGFTTPPSQAVAPMWLISTVDTVTAGLGVLITGITSAVVGLDTVGAAARAWRRREHHQRQQARWQALDAWSDNVVWLGQLCPDRRAHMNHLLDQARQLWRTADATFDHAALWIRVWDAAHSSSLATRLETALTRHNGHHTPDLARKAHVERKIAALDTRVADHSRFLADQQRLHEHDPIHPAPVTPPDFVADLDLTEADADADALLPLSPAP